MITLDNLTEQPPGTLDQLPIETLARLKSAAEEHAASASQMLAILHGVFERRYADRLNSTGTTHREDGGYDIKITVPKRVDWNQQRVAEAVATVESWGEDPTEYVDMKITVAERKYDAWPSAIRDLFEPARTVKAGKPKFEVSELSTDEREAA